MKNKKFMLKNGQVSAKILDNQLEIKANLVAIRGKNTLKKHNFRVITEDMQMEKLNINLKDITYYLIQLFYKTDKKYSCTQTKIGKLISILAFRYARNGKILFNESIYKYQPNCGTLIKDLAFLPKRVYTRDLDIDDMDKEQIICDSINNVVDIPIQYIKTEGLSCELEREIEELFIQFGAYPASVLGEYLNNIADKLISEDTKLNLEKIENINIEDFTEAEINPIIKYIYSR